MRILSYGDNNLGAEVCFCDWLQSSHDDWLHDDGKQQYVQQAWYIVVVYNFDFVNNKTDLFKVSVIFFSALLSTTLLFTYYSDLSLSEQYIN